MSENVTLSANQKKALAALISEKTVRDAAAKIGLAEKTIYRYFKEPAFMDAFTAAQDELTQEAVNRLIGGLGKALDTLEDLIAHSDQTNKRLASVAWIDRALKLKEFAVLEQKIKDLEERIK
jgi:hypothetical protein